jgi:hypothetical protein
LRWFIDLLTFTLRDIESAWARFNMDGAKNEPRKLTPEAQRALAEAEARRAAAAVMPKEAGGPSGPEPTRYGDWERKGLAVDF